MMDKELATFRLGGTEEQAARWIGVSPDIYRQWPDLLHPVMTDRVIAAIIRREAAKAMGLSARQFFADYRGESFVREMLTRVSIAAVMANLMPRVPPELEQRADKPRKRPGKTRRKPAAQVAAALPG